MGRTNLAFWGVLLTAFLAGGCGDDGGGSGGSGSGGSAGDGDGDGDCIEVNDAQGGEACGNETCSAGEYCDAVICKDGCRNTSTCPEGQYCDLSTASDVKAGTCREPGSNDDVCGGGGDGDGDGDGGGDAQSCVPRCLGIFDRCDFGEDFPVSASDACTDVCGRTDQDEQDCLAEAECSEFDDGIACGVDLRPSGGSSEGG